jgi:hypothetical protein
MNDSVCCETKLHPRTYVTYLNGQFWRIHYTRCTICGKYAEIRREPVHIAAAEESGGDKTAGLPR